MSTWHSENWFLYITFYKLQFSFKVFLGTHRSIFDINFYPINCYRLKHRAIFILERGADIPALEPSLVLDPSVYHIMVWKDGSVFIICWISLCASTIILRCPVWSPGLSSLIYRILYTLLVATPFMWISNGVKLRITLIVIN